MSKRFTDTDKYKKPFIRGLQGAYKVLWDYLYHECNHAGIWIVDFQIAQIYIGKDLPINKQAALKYFNDGEIRIVEFDGGKKWFIPSFIEFQYGVLNPDNRVHNSIILVLNKHNLIKNNKVLLIPLQGVKDMDKDKDKDKEKEVFNFKNSFLDLGVNKQILDDWLKVRKNKKATNSETAFNNLASQIKTSKKSANECIKIAAENSWSGFNAEWLNKPASKTNQIDNMDAGPNFEWDPNATKE